MKNTKGFTLVELLAVIVILAIVALVTTPAILNIVNDARKSGAEDKAWGTIDAVKLAYTQAQSDGFDESLATGSGVTLSGTELTVDVTKADTGFKYTDAIGGEKTRKITLNGERPSTGTVTINLDSGIITAKDLKFSKNGTYTCSTNDEGSKVCCESGTKTNVTCS